MRKLVACPPAKDGTSYDIPVNTEIILSKAFTGTSLTSVTLLSALKIIEEGAFEKCNSSLRLHVKDATRKITLTDSNATFDPEEDYVYISRVSESGSFTLGVDVKLNSYKYSGINLRM